MVHAGGPPLLREGSAVGQCACLRAVYSPDPGGQHRRVSLAVTAWEQSMNCDSGVLEDRHLKSFFPLWCSISWNKCHQNCKQRRRYASRKIKRESIARPQHFVNVELPNMQAGFRKGKPTRPQIGRSCWIMEKAREFQKNIYFCFIDYTKALTVWITTNCGKFLKRQMYQNTLTYLLKNLYAGQESTVRTRQGTMDWF